MKKGFIIKLLFGLSILAVAVVYLLNIVKPGLLPGEYTTPNYLAMGIAFLWAFFFILKAFKGDVVTKKANLFVSLILAVVGIFLLLNNILHQENVVIPAIVVAVAVFIVLSIIFTGGKSYDTADNEKVGYKNYRQRKAAEEKKHDKEDRY
jgi:hypothetical protein